MIEPDDNDIRSRVVYVPWSDAPPSEWEYGVIMSFSHLYVFVKYDGSRAVNGIATSRNDLRWEK